MAVKNIDFIGIGAPKSGSTWLSVCLKEHPEIAFSSQKSRKELCFFNLENVWGDNTSSRYSTYGRGLSWYLDQFPEPKSGQIVGEYSVTYLSDPVAYKRIKETFPECKIVVSLRNPVEMLYSLHWFFFHGAVIDTPESFDVLLDKGLFVDKGFYYKHLKNFFDTFSRENIHVVLFDDICKDPEKVLRDLYTFLGVSPNFQPPSMGQQVNKSFKTKSSFLKKFANRFLLLLHRFKLEKLRLWIIESKIANRFYFLINKTYTKYPAITPEQRIRGYSIYKEDIDKLEKLIDRDLSGWKIQN